MRIICLDPAQLGIEPSCWKTDGEISRGLIRAPSGWGGPAQAPCRPITLPSLRKEPLMGSDMEGTRLMQTETRSRPPRRDALWSPEGRGSSQSWGAQISGFPAVPGLRDESVTLVSSQDTIQCP